MGYVVLYDVICSYITLFRVISYRENFYHARPLSPVNGRDERQKPPLTGAGGCALSVIKGCQPQAGCHPYRYFGEI